MAVAHPPDTLVLLCGEVSRDGVRDLNCDCREISECVRMGERVKMDLGNRKYNS